MKRRFLFILPIVSVLVAVGSVLFAVEAVGQGTTLSATGRGTPQIQVVSDSGQVAIAPEGGGVFPVYEALPGATLTVKVPSSWKSGLLLVHFSAIASCPVNQCIAGIFIDGQQANPPIGPQYLGSTPQPSQNSLVANWPFEMDGWMTVGPGTHTVEVEVGNYGPGADCPNCQGTFDLSSWTLSVERIWSS
jgi:hypothetical protein